MGARLSQLLLVFALMLSSSGVAAPAANPELQIDVLRQRCFKRLEKFEQEESASRVAGNILLLAGASIGALGSALAGFLNKARLRKAMAIIGALGAVITVIPRTLDAPEELKQRREMAHIHSAWAAKVHHQIQYLDEEAKREARKFVIARLVDCDSSNPPVVPPLSADLSKQVEKAGPPRD